MTNKPDDHIIVAIHLTDRVQQAQPVQRVLTDYGTNIKTRIGLHEVANQSTGPNGLILLEMIGPRERCFSIIDVLNGLEGVEAKKLVFEH